MVCWLKDDVVDYNWKATFNADIKFWYHQVNNQWDEYGPINITGTEKWDQTINCSKFAIITIHPSTGDSSSLTYQCFVYLLQHHCYSGVTSNTLYGFSKAWFPRPKAQTRTITWLLNFSVEGSQPTTHTLSTFTNTTHCIHRRITYTNHPLWVLRRLTEIPLRKRIARGYTISKLE